MNFIKYSTAGKDYIYLTDEKANRNISELDIKTLCDRHNGIGADGIFAVYQKSPKNGIITGFAQNGELLHDHSSASICAAFALNSTKSFKEQEFTYQNRDIFTVISDFYTSSPLITADLKKAADNAFSDYISRRTELGNRILTLTAIDLHSLYAVHFTENKASLDIGYLGQKLSSNSQFNKKAGLILAQKTDKNTFEIDYYENKSGNPRPVISAFAATALAACRTENAVYGEEIKVSCNNSQVFIYCKEDGSAVTQCTAKRIFSGSFDKQEYLLKPPVC